MINDVIDYYVHSQHYLSQFHLKQEISRITLLWRYNEHDCVSDHQPYDCLLNRLFRRRSKKTSKLRVTGLCAGSSPGTGEFSAQMAGNAENVSMWWRHHELTKISYSIWWALLAFPYSFFFKPIISRCVFLCTLSHMNENVWHKIINEICNFRAKIKHA